jgi:protein translocase SecG subunit
MQVLPIIQVALAVITIILVLLQERSGGGSSLLGGGDGSGTYQSRRGVEQVIFVATIASTVAFAGLAIAQLYFAKY